MFKKVMFFVILIAFLMVPLVPAEEDDIEVGDIGIITTGDFERVKVVNLNGISNGIKTFVFGEIGVIKRNGLVMVIAVNAVTGEVLVEYTPPKESVLLPGQLPKTARFIVSIPEFQSMVEEYKRIQEEKRRNANPIPCLEEKAKKQKLKKKVQLLLNGNHK